MDASASRFRLHPERANARLVGGYNPVYSHSSHTTQCRMTGGVESPDRGWFRIRRKSWYAVPECVCGVAGVQGYLAHKKQRPPRTLQKSCAWGAMEVLGRWAVSNQRGTPVGTGSDGVSEHRPDAAALPLFPSCPRLRDFPNLSRHIQGPGSRVQNPGSRV